MIHIVATLCQQLSTHQVVTVVLPTTDGKILNIQKAAAPEPVHMEIYATPKISMELMKPVKTWRWRPPHSDGMKS